MLPIFGKIITGTNIAIDLGTANTRIYSSEKGMLSETPSLVSEIRKDSNNDRLDPYIKYLNSKLSAAPLRGGVIIDPKTAVKLLKPLFKRANKRLSRSVSLACAPTDITKEERSMLAEAVLDAGSSHVAIMPEPWAAAIGAGIDVTLPNTQLLIDFGEGVVDMVFIRNNSIVHAAALRTACYDIHKAIHQSIISRYQVSPYPSETERLTRENDITLHQQYNPIKKIFINGINIIKRCEVSIEVNTQTIINAMIPAMDKILKMIDMNIKKMPEEIFCELTESGICLTGGGTYIKGIDKLIATKTNLPVRIAPNPLHSTINGAIHTLKNFKHKKNWWEEIDWPVLSS
jgi:rod shape-determining protein MreB